jgi:transcriptional regulator with PAS, ATPase and Fis domain
MRRIFDMLPSIADTDSTVLIEGETGTGKELIARAIHNLSARRKRPLVAVNCSALPDQLLESELFGYKAGAFTDAKRDKIGRFAQARGGTIFLDEIGDISGALQVRLLRVLQEKVYEPLGSVAPEKADVRVIAATNRNLETLTRRGEFRDDLYYRINVVRIDIPPLRNRKEDIPLLVRTFVQRFNLLNERQIINLTADALKILMEHDFPGNVRELENVIEHAFVLCKGKFIEPRHLPVYLQHSGDEKTNTDPDRKALQQLEAEYILEALKRNGGNRLKTAEELGMHKSTLFRKIRKLGIDLPNYDGRNSRNSSGSTS